MESPYRTAALERVSRKVTRWGTGERLALRVPMSEAEVLEAFGRLTQAERPSRSDKKSGNYRPFWGRVGGRRFQLVPLRSKASALHVRVSLEPGEGVTIIDVDIELALVTYGLLALMMLAMFAWLIARADIGDLIYFVVRGSAHIVVFVVILVTAVRV